MENLEELRRRLTRLQALYIKTDVDWIDVRVELGTCLYAARQLFLADRAFGEWLAETGLNVISHQERAALINLGAEPDLMRTVLNETDSRSIELIWRNNQGRFTSARKPDAEPSSIVEDLVSELVTGLEPEPAISETPPAEEAPPVEATVIRLPVVAKPQLPPQPKPDHAIPNKSKLRELVGAKTADILHKHFRASKRMFTDVASTSSPQVKTLLGYLAGRCQEDDYPAELFDVSTWSLRLLYPHLPERFLQHLPQKLNSTLSNLHKTLVETERRFMASPEFGVTDPPLVGFNRVQQIYNGLLNAKAGTKLDPDALHKPKFASNENKPPVVIRGTQLWPTVEGSGYCYDDLRCACGFASDVLAIFRGERGESVPMTTQSQKLRHLMSWLEGGYNSVGSTTPGMLKALADVVHAYGADKSAEMKLPQVRVTKADGDARA